MGQSHTPPSAGSAERPRTRPRLEKEGPAPRNLIGDLDAAAEPVPNMPLVPAEESDEESCMIEGTPMPWEEGGDDGLRDAEGAENTQPYASDQDQRGPSPGPWGGPGGVEWAWRRLPL